MAQILNNNSSQKSLNSHYVLTCIVIGLAYVVVGIVLVGFDVNTI